MPFETDNLAPYLQRLHQARHCYIAYSGGMDSHVLLHALTMLLSPERVTAIHINHNLSENAGVWEKHCRQQCELLGVAFRTESVDVRIQGQGLEQAARRARYSVFEKILLPGDLLAMGHHADDQVETVLYRLLRGSGVRGLAGMPEQRPLGKGELFRPLLNYRRTELEEYARKEELLWIEDESNSQLEYDRNFLRHQVVPSIANRWQDYAERISHSAGLCNEAYLLQENLAASDMGRLAERSERLGWSINLPEFLDLPVPRRANVLRYWAGLHELDLPGHKALQAIEQGLLNASEDAVPLVHWGNAELRRYGERVYLLESLNLNTTTNNIDEGSLLWDLTNTLSLPLGRLAAEVTVNSAGSLKVPDGGKITVVFRQGGERCQPVGRNGSNTLKKLFQEARLEPWLRSYAPLIFVDGELAAVADLWVCEGFQTGAEEQGVRLIWQVDAEI